MIVCGGSIALDTTHTPFKTFDRVLGGSGSFFGVSASYFTKTALVSAVGSDFPEPLFKKLEKHCDLSGVQRIRGKNFFFESKFDFDMQHREALKFEPGVFAEFSWKVPEHLRNPDFLFLSTHNPSYNERLIDSAGAKMVFGDTIEYLAGKQKAEILKLMKKTQGFVLNDAEARILAGENSLIKAGRKLQEHGLEVVVIKKGEHGGLLFYGKDVIPFPAYPLDSVVDPTGAGDAFAGGFIGWLDKKKQVSEKTLREACYYGTVMASICVQDFGLEALLSLNKDKIGSRFKEYKRLAGF